MKENYVNLIKSLEKQNYRLECYYNTCIKLLDYELENKKSNFNSIGGKKIYIYGCGEIGKRYYKIIKDKTNVIAFIDQSAKENSYKCEGINVISLDKINSNDEFDYIIITLEDLYQVIYDDLIRNGMAEEKIKGIDEMIN